MQAFTAKENEKENRNISYDKAFVEKETIWTRTQACTTDI